MRALVELAAAGGGKQITAERLADAQGIPRKFLQNILLELRRAGIVASHRGPDGGHSLARAADAITVASGGPRKPTSPITRSSARRITW